MQLIDDNFDWQAYDLAPELTKVQRASSFVDETIARFLPNDERAQGSRSPWRKIGTNLMFRPSEVTLWAGINGHGKSLIVSQVALALMQQEQRVLKASFEMRPAATMQRMTRQAAWNVQPSLRYIRAFHAWTDDRLWIFNHLGEIAWRKVAAVLRYAATELKVQHAFVDSFMKCAIRPDDYAAQKDFVGALCDIAQSTSLHVHLVVHMRKGEDEADDVNKFDIRGAAEIIDQPDNIVIVQRNKRKERMMQKKGADLDDIADTPDTWMKIDKQRHHPWERRVGLFFNADVQGFVGAAEERGEFLSLDLETFVE